LPNREDIAVERILRMLPLACPKWYASVGLDVNSHWALVRPTLMTPMLREPQAEVDVILGRMARLADSSGAVQAIWPPPTDYLVAVEAKCPPVSWDDTEPWANSTPSKSNLEQQLKRDIKLGFSRVAALHVIATPYAEDFWSAIQAASELGNHFLPEAERQVANDVDSLRVGHCILSVGEVWSKSWHQAGTLSVLRMNPAPQIGSGLPVIREQVDSFLRECPQPRCWRAVYLRDGKEGWKQLDDLFAPLVERNSRLR
jgi:hypothetical protein